MKRYGIFGLLPFDPCLFRSMTLSDLEGRMRGAGSSVRSRSYRFSNNVFGVITQVGRGGGFVRDNAPPDARGGAIAQGV